MKIKVRCHKRTTQLRNI